MPPRQVWLFQFGCWAAIATAVFHLVLAMTMPSGDAAMVTVLFGVCFSVLGVLGLVVAKRAQPDALLMYGVARSAAVASVTLLVLSLMHFSIYPGMFIAAVTTCFTVSAVKAPGV